MISIGIGIPINKYSSAGGGIDPQAQAHYDRVIADGGVCTYGLLGVDTYVKALKSIYSISDINAKFIYVRHLDYLGYKAGSGTGATAGRAIQTIYSLTGVNYDLRQTTVASQPALGAWTGTNFISTFANASYLESTAKANPNNSKITVIIQATNADTAFGGLCGHGSNWRIEYNNSLVPRFYLADGSVFNATTSISGGLNGYLRVIVTTSGSDLLINWATSSNGTIWTALGTQVTATGKAGQIGSASHTLRVGSNAAGAGSRGNWFQLQVLDSTDTLIFNMQPSNYNRSINQTQFTASTGETYSVVIPAALGFKAMIVDQTMIQGNGTSTGMQAASATLNTLQFTQYNAWRKFSNATTSVGILNEFGSSVSAGQGLAFAPNEVVNTESVYTNSNVGLNGTSWTSNSLLLKLSTFRGNIANTREQSLATNNSNNTFNADQATANNTTAIVATGDNLFARNNAASLWMNAIWSAGILSVSTDSGTEETAMYNFIAPLIEIV